jgi:putative NADPH-quinone reductase/uncharacterized protein (DUF2267 family)
MRNIAIIDGHPDPSQARLNHALADRYAEAARAAGNEVRRIQVAALDFPLLRSPENFYNQQAPEAVQQAQRDIAWADHLVFFYPLWHGDMPALLKGFVEQTFRPGFAMDYGGRMRFPKQLFKGKSARIVVTMGMPAIIYRAYFRGHSVKGFKRSTLGLCGVSPVRLTLLGTAGVAGDGIRRERLVERMAKIAECDAAGHARGGANRGRVVIATALVLTSAAVTYLRAASARKAASESTEPPARETPAAEDGSHVLAESVAHARMWLRDVNRAMGGWMTHDYALQALRSALHPLRDHLTVEQSAHLSAQLPVFIRGIFYEEWVPARVPVRDRDEDHLLGSVLQHFRGKAKTPDPKDVLRAVYGVLHGHITTGESQNIYNALPAGMRKYWPAQGVFEEVQRSAPSPEHST